MPMILSNPFKARVVAETAVETDTLDVRTLANLLRGDLIAECHVANPTVAGQRQLPRHRAALVQ